MTVANAQADAAVVVAASEADLAHLMVTARAAEDVLEKKVGRPAMRRGGLTLVNVRRVAKDLARDGVLTSDMSRAEVREVVLDALHSENPKDFGRLTAINLDAILAFIEKLMPLIMKIIAMFG